VRNNTQTKSNSGSCRCETGRQPLINIDIKRREENQLDTTECFIAIIICLACFGHLYAHHQELATIIVLLPRMVCKALVAGGVWSGAGQLLEQLPSSRTHGLLPCS